MGQKEQASTPVNLDVIRLVRQGFAGSGMTQEELSRSSGIPRSTLANILSPTAGPRLVHVSQLVKIALAIGADPREWMGELERLERQRRGDSADDLAPRRTRKRAAPAVQKRAARSRSGGPPAGKE